MNISVDGNQVYFTHTGKGYGCGISARLSELSLLHILKLLCYKVVDIIKRGFKKDEMV